MWTSNYSPTLGFINAFRDLAFWKSVPALTKFFDGAARRAHQLGYHLEQFCLREKGMDSRAMSRILRSRGIAGLLIGSMPSARGHLSLDWEAFASVCQGYTLVHPRLSRVCNDYSETMWTIIRQLRHFGYRKIGLALWAPINTRGKYIWSGVHLVYQHYLPARHRVPALLPEVWDEAIFKTWFLKYRPEAIITCHTEIEDWLHSIGRETLNDVGLVLNDLHRERGDDWAGMDQRIDMVGATAVDVVVAQLLNNERGIPEAPKLVLTEGRWQNGRTLRQIRAPAEPLKIALQTVLRDVRPHPA